MTDSPFSQPGGPSGDRFDLGKNGQGWLGTLLLVYPKELKPQFDAENGYPPTDVVVADIVFVDGVEAGTVFRGAFLFGKFIVADTKGSIGKFVLGRLGQKQGKKGLGWCILPFTDADVNAALPVHKQWLAGEFESTQPAATNDPWALKGGPAAVPDQPGQAAVSSAAKLIAKGVPAEKVAAMSEETRALLLAQM